MWSSAHSFQESVFLFYNVELGIELRLIVIYMHVAKYISYIILTI